MGAFGPGGGGSSGGGTPADPIQYQGTSPVGTAVGHSAELYLGPSNGYSYSSGGAGYLPGCPFASTLTRFSFRCTAMGVDSTVRLRTSGGTQLWSKVLTAGQTLIDDVISVSVAHDVLVQPSIEPASGGPTVDAWSFGWTRKAAP